MLEILATAVVLAVVIIGFNLIGHTRAIKRQREWTKELDDEDTRRRK